MLSRSGSDTRSAEAARFASTVTFGGTGLQLGGEKSIVVVPSGTDERRAGSIPWPERCLDLAITIIVLPLVALVAAVIAIAIYIDSPGPVIYRSRRVGRDGQPFEMLKFRKMRRESPSHPVTLDDDARFTPIGRFLAASRLDELPQVLNVLRGQMRLVGPRPELEYFVAQFADQYREILSVTPGVTGNAQLKFVSEASLLSGPHPESAYTSEVLPVKIEIDLDYVRHHTVASDLWILVRTAALPAVLMWGRLRTRSRFWLSSAACAAALGLLFALLLSHLP